MARYITHVYFRLIYFSFRNEYDIRNTLNTDSVRDRTIEVKIKWSSFSLFFNDTKKIWLQKKNRAYIYRVCGFFLNVYAREQLNVSQSTFIWTWWWPTRRFFCFVFWGWGGGVLLLGMLRLLGSYYEELILLKSYTLINLRYLNCYSNKIS